MAPLRPLSEIFPNIHSATVPEVPGVPRDQLDLPVALAPSGVALTPREIVAQQELPVELNLGAEEKTELVLRRIAAQGDYHLSWVGGEIDQAGALIEVQLNTELGQSIKQRELRIAEKVASRARSAALLRRITAVPGDPVDRPAEWLRAGDDPKVDSGGG